MPFMKGDSVFAKDSDNNPHSGEVVDYDQKRQIYRVRHDDDVPGTAPHEYPEAKVTRRVSRA
jgi:hypothetical protein